MRLVNTSSYPDRHVRRLVRLGIGPDLAAASWLTVRVAPRRSNRESSEAAGNGTRGPVTITLRIEQPASKFPRDYKGGAGYLPMSAETWQERIVFLAAHEASHVKLRRAGRWDEDTEVRADRAGLWRLRYYRLRRPIGAA